MSNTIDVQVCGNQGMFPCTYKTVVLKPNLFNNKNLLVQHMMNQQNTKYVIKYDYIIDPDIKTGVATVSESNVSQCVNPDYAAAFAAYNLAHDAWIDADNAYTNNPNETTLATKNNAYAAYSAAQTTLNNTPQYYYYAANAIVVKQGQHISIPEGCILLNASLNGITSFVTASANTTVYVGSLTIGNYNYTVQNAIVMPSSCLIEFDGGSISNGAIIGNNTILIYNQELTDIMKNVLRQGTFVYNNTLSADEESLTEQGNLIKIKNAGVQGKHLNGNVVDDEDIHLTSANKLQFKDRGTTDGMGRIILRKKSSFASQLTQTNTIYEIRYDFDLNNQSITIPANCVLEFEGGSLKNGTIVGNSAIIDGIADIRCSISGVGNDVTHLNWFIKESNKNTAFNRALACAGSTILDGDNTLISISQTISFDENTKCDLKNLNVEFTASSDGQSMFLFNASQIYRGRHGTISHCVFKQLNPSEYKNVHCIHYRLWDSTTRGMIDNVVVRDFSGYMFLCESYLQEFAFERFKGINVGGFVSFNKEYNTDKAFGDYGYGSSNILYFENCGIDDAINVNNDITDIVDLTNSIQTTFINCVWQGTAEGKADTHVINVTHYGTNVGTGFGPSRVDLINSWSEFFNYASESDTNTIVLGKNIHITTNIHQYTKIHITGRNCLVKSDVGLSVASDLFIIDDNTYPTIILDSIGRSFDVYSLIDTLRPIANIQFNYKGVKINNYEPSDCYFYEGIKEDMLPAMKKMPAFISSLGVIKYENGFELLSAGLIGASRRVPQYASDFITNTDRKSCIFRFVYRAYPLVEITSENVDTFKSRMSNNQYIFIISGDYTNMFEVGQSLNPEENIWREVFVVDPIRPTSASRYIDFNKDVGIDIAVSELYFGNIPYSPSIIIDPTDNTKLKRVNNNEISKYGSVRPSIVSTTGFQFFDTSIDKPIYWNGSKWIDQNDFSANISKGSLSDANSLISNNKVTRDDFGYRFICTDIGKLINLSYKWESVFNQSVPKTSQTTGVAYNNIFVYGYVYRVETSTPRNATTKIYLSKNDTLVEGEYVTIVTINYSPTNYVTNPITIDYRQEDYPYIIIGHGNSSGDVTFVIEKRQLSWKEEDGAAAGVSRNGATSARPVGSDIYVGFMFMDTTLGKPIYASAINGDTVTWVDATGAPV